MTIRKHQISLYAQTSIRRANCMSCITNVRSIELLGLNSETMEDIYHNTKHKSN